jgi:hypothetical protein
MPRFQSKLFNWIDHSLPVKWGRKVRRWLAEAKKQPDFNLPLTSKIRAEIWEVIDTIQQLQQSIKHNILRLPTAKATTSAQTDRRTDRQLTANRVGDFAQPQSKLPKADRPKYLLKSISDAIAALAKIVRSIIRIQPNSSKLSNNLEDNWSDHGADCDPDLFPGRIPAKLPEHLRKARLINQAESDLVGSDLIGSNLVGSNLTVAQTKLAEIQQNLNSNLNRYSTELVNSESWWEKMQRLLQAAIAYFLAKDARTKKLPADNIVAKNQADSQITKASSNKVRRPKPNSLELNNLEDWYEESLPEQKSKQIAATEVSSASFKGTLISQNQNSNANLKIAETQTRTTLTTIEEWAASDLLELEELGLRNQAREKVDSPLRAWIETQSEFLGYAYSPIMAVIHWCDRLIAKIERFLESSSNAIYQTFLKIWQILKQMFNSPKPPKS